MVNLLFVKRFSCFDSTRGLYTWIWAHTLQYTIQLRVIRISMLTFIRPLNHLKKSKESMCMYNIQRTIKQSLINKSPCMKIDWVFIWTKKYDKKVDKEMRSNHFFMKLSRLVWEIVILSFYLTQYFPKMPAYCILCTFYLKYL